MQSLRLSGRQRVSKSFLCPRCPLWGSATATPNPCPFPRPRLFSTKLYPQEPQHEHVRKTVCRINGTIVQRGRDYSVDRRGLMQGQTVPIPIKSTNPHEEQRGKRLKQLGTRLLLSIFSILGATITYVCVSSEQATPIFDPPRFTPFTIINREEASPTSIILTLRPSSAATIPLDAYQKSWERGTWSVEVKQPQLQIARSYTPLPPRDGDTNGDLRFLIRREHKGEVSGYLHALGVGRRVELRGPKPELDLTESIKDVVFLAGGTGIAPALQVVHALLERRITKENEPRIRIVWANRRREDCIGGFTIVSQDTESGYIVKELENLQKRYSDYLEVEYLVDEEGTFLDQKKISQLTKSESEVKVGPVHTRIESKILIISGPEGFINYFAGPKRWKGGEEGQGELGGVLGKMHLRDWKIWKL